MQAVTGQPYRWQASSHSHLFQAGSSMMVQPFVGAGLPAMQAVTEQAYRWQASSHRYLFQAGSSVMVQPLWEQ